MTFCAAETTLCCSSSQRAYWLGELRLQGKGLGFNRNVGCPWCNCEAGRRRLRRSLEHDHQRHPMNATMSKQEGYEESCCCSLVRRVGLPAH